MKMRRKQGTKIEDIKALRRFSYFYSKLGLKSFTYSYKTPIFNGPNLVGWENNKSSGLGLAEAKAFCEKWIDYYDPFKST